MEVDNGSGSNLIELVRLRGRTLSARTLGCIRADAPQRPRGRIFTASADSKTRPQGKRGRGRMSGR
jgi:hypothetical protein